MPAVIISALILFLSLDPGPEVVDRGLPSSRESPPIGLTLVDSMAGPVLNVPLAARSFSFSLADRPAQDEKKVPPHQRKKPGRAILEFAAIMAVSQANYWIKYDHWSEDWEYRATWADQKRRFFGFEAWKFDTNRYGTNWTHSLSGTINYSLARANGLDIAESMRFGLAAALYWEYIVEYKEVLSINDTIINPLAGMSLGEAWHQIGLFFANRQGIAARLLSFFNPIIKINRRLDGGRGPGGMNPGAGGHDIHFDIGYCAVRAGKTPYPSDLLHLGFRAALMNVAGWGGPGRLDLRADTPASELRAGALIKAGRIEEFDLSSRVVLTALVRQHAGPGPRGIAWSLGLGSGLSVLNKRAVAGYDQGRVDYGDLDALRLEEPRNFRDKFCIVHVIGPAFDAAFYNRDLRIRLKWDAYLDFSLMHAFALNSFSRRRSIQGFKPTLLYYGYYYGLGLSSLAGFSADWRSLRLGGGVDVHLANAIDGRNRFQGIFEDDIAAKDSRLRLELGFGIRLPGIPARVAMRWEGIARKGVLSDITDREFENRVFADLQLVF